MGLCEREVMVEGKDGETERRRDGETERRRDGETKRQRDRETYLSAYFKIVFFRQSGAFWDSPSKGPLTSHFYDEEDYFCIFPSANYQV